jgi:hypothetical protein
VKKEVAVLKLTIFVVVVCIAALVAAALPKALPPTGGASIASLVGLGAGVLLVGGGLLFHKLVK